MKTVQAATSYIGLTLLCALLYLPGLMNIPIVDRDEPHFAQASRQMLENKDYWHIEFQDHPRHLKPPGLYWLHVLEIKMLSLDVKKNSVWPYRLISAIAGWLAVLLLFAFTSTIYSKQIAYLASALLASSLLLIIESHLIVTDAVLLATMILMQGALWKIYLSYRQNLPNHWLFPLFFWLGLSAGILVKGITPLIALFTLSTLCAIESNLRWLSRLKPISGLLFLLILLSACFLPLSLASHSNFISDMLKSDVVPKLIGGQQSHGMLPGYFLLILPLMLGPGALLIFQAGIQAWQQRQYDNHRFLLAWIIPSWIFFEIVPTKLPEYVLPIYPALAVLIAYAAYLPNLQNFKKSYFRWIEKFQYSLWLFCNISLAVMIIFLPYYIEHWVSAIAITASILLLISNLIAMIVAMKKKFFLALIIAIAGTTVSLGLTSQWVLPGLKNLWISEKIAAIMEQQPLKPLLAIDYEEPSLVFLLGTHSVRMISMQQFEQSARQLLDAPQWILVAHPKNSEVHRLAEKENHCMINHAVSLKGFQYTKGRWITLDLFLCNKL